MKPMTEILSDLFADPAGDSPEIRHHSPDIRHHQTRMDKGSSPLSPLSPKHEAAIRRWLAHIGETDAETINDLLAACASNPEGLAYFLGRAQEAKA